MLGKLENSTDVSNLSFLIILTVEMVETTTDLLAFIVLSLNRIYYPWALYHWPEYDGYLVLIFVQHINHIKYDRSQNYIPKRCMEHSASAMLVFWKQIC